MLNSCAAARSNLALALHDSHAGKGALPTRPKVMMLEAGLDRAPESRVFFSKEQIHPIKFSHLHRGPLLRFNGQGLSFCL